MMRFSRLASVLLIVALVTPVYAQSWSRFTSTEDRFRIYAPGEATTRELQYPSEYGAVLPARVYSFAAGTNSYSVTVVDYTDARKIHAARDRTEADYEIYWEIDVRASIAYAATNLRQRGEVTYDAYHYIDRVEGHQLQISNADQSRTYAAIYLHDSRLYILEATVAPEVPPPVMFQQSLEFLDADGERIRYENYSDAPKVHDPDFDPDAGAEVP